MPLAVTISCLSGCQCGGYTAASRCSAGWLDTMLCAVMRDGLPCASHIFHSMGISCSTELRQRLGCGVVGSHTGSRYRGLGSECCFKLNSCFIAQLQLIINTGLEQSCNGSASGCDYGVSDSPPSACSSGLCVGQRIRSL